MCHDNITINRYRFQRMSQRGFALVSAIFLLVVLAALGGFMVNFSSVQHATSTQDLLGSRAYQAARTGIEWGVFQVRNPENTNPLGAVYICPATASTLENLGGALAGFTVDVQCSVTVDTEGDNRIRIYQITSTASIGAVGTASFVQRRLSAAVETCRKIVDESSC